MSYIPSSSNHVSLQRAVAFTYLPQEQRKLIENWKTAYYEQHKHPYDRALFCITDSNGDLIFISLYEIVINFWKLNHQHLNYESRDDLIALILIITLEEVSPSNTPAAILSLFRDLYNLGASPSTFIERITINGNIFGQVEFFQIVYLYWKTCEEPLPVELDSDYNALFTTMISDHRTDLTAKFSEDSIDYPHFALPDATYGQGYTLVSTTLAHYALAIKDRESALSMIHSNRLLLSTKCTMMFDNNLLYEQVIWISETSQPNSPTTSTDTTTISNLTKICDIQSKRFKERLVTIQNLELDDPTFGVLAYASFGHKDPCISPVIRITNISLLHIAARNADIKTCFYLAGSNMNILEADSFKATPLTYLETSCNEGLVPNTALKHASVLYPRTATPQRSLPQASQTIVKSGYINLYNLGLKTAHYVRERLTRKSMRGEDSRNGNSFLVEREVPKLNRGSDKDYARSGYDRGHLAPAADFTYEREITDSFVLSNICPQHPAFNQGYWKQFEALVRSKIFQNDVVEVYTGPIFAPTYINGIASVQFVVIGEHKIPVPTHFFKVIHLHNISTQTNAYILPNGPIDKSIENIDHFQVRLEKIQELTGISFALGGRIA